jgi:hypothetical protein
MGDDDDLPRRSNFIGEDIERQIRFHARSVTAGLLLRSPIY